VRPCLPGQRAEAVSRSNSSSSVKCLMCAVPSFSFTASPCQTASIAPAAAAVVAHSAWRSWFLPGQGPSAGQEVCQVCPAGGLCIGGMVTPAQGCYQPHPRSASIHGCPHGAACLRDNSSMLDLQALQCANRQFIYPEEVDPNPFTLLQCSKGYAGRAAVL